MIENPRNLPGGGRTDHIWLDELINQFMGNPSIPENLADFSRAHHTSEMVPLVFDGDELVIVPYVFKYNGINVVTIKQRKYEDGKPVVRSTVLLNHAEINLGELDIRLKSYNPGAALAQEELVQVGEYRWDYNNFIRLLDEEGKPFVWPNMHKVAGTHELGRVARVLEYAGNWRLRQAASRDQKVKPGDISQTGSFERFEINLN